MNIFSKICNALDIITFTKSKSKVDSMTTRQTIMQILRLIATIGFAYVIWIILAVKLQNENPVVVVLSESMAPSFNRGDILLLKGLKSDFSAGKITVFSIKGREIPIVHRLHINTRNNRNYLRVLTKGDNNRGYDQSLYFGHNDWIDKDSIKAEVIGYVPYLGFFSILLSEHPFLKYFIFAVLPYFSIFLEN